MTEPPRGALGHWIRIENHRIANYQAIVRAENGEDVLEIKIEISEGIFNDELKKMLELKNKIARSFEADLGIAPHITLVEQDSLRSAGGGKVNRIVDMRSGRV